MRVSCGSGDVVDDVDRDGTDGRRCRDSVDCNRRDRNCRSSAAVVAIAFPGVGHESYCVRCSQE